MSFGGISGQGQKYILVQLQSGVCRHCPRVMHSVVNECIGIFLFSVTSIMRLELVKNKTGSEVNIWATLWRQHMETIVWMTHSQFTDYGSKLYRIQNVTTAVITRHALAEC